MTVKQLVLDTVRDMPAGVSWDELLEELQLLADLRRADADIDAGHFLANDEVERDIEAWFTK